MTEFYKTKRWREKREHILRRDKWTDQVALRFGSHIAADTVHHILPRETYPQYMWCDWNLISVNRRTHLVDLHDKFTGGLTRLGKQIAREAATARGIKMQTVTMVIGLPGSGKSTYARQHLGGGLAYDLDAIASAFRLTVPHSEPPHAGARRMAASLRRGWIEAAKEQASDIYIVRGCPDEEELAETMPDQIVVCTGQYAKREYKYDRKEYQDKIDRAIQWAEANMVGITFVGKSGE